MEAKRKQEEDPKNKNEEPKKKLRCCDHCRHPGCLGPLPFDEDSKQLTVNMPGVAIVNSKQQGGKSHLLRYLYYKNRDKFAWIIAFSNSKDGEDNLDWFDKKYQCTFLKSDDPKYDGRTVLMNAVNEQKKQPKGSRKIGGIIIDDDRSGFNTNELKLVCTQAFKYDLWVWISVHNAGDLTAGIREQATDVAIFEVETKNSFRVLYENYGQNYYTQKDFEETVKANTGDHKFLWRDVKGGKPFQLWRCPPIIPKFFIDFEKKAEDDGGATDAGGSDVP